MGEREQRGGERGQRGRGEGAEGRGEEAVGREEGQGGTAFRFLEAWESKDTPSGNFTLKACFSSCRH